MKKKELKQENIRLGTHGKTMEAGCSILYFT